LPQALLPFRQHNMNYSALITAWHDATQPPTGVTGTGLTGSMTTAQKIVAVNGWTVPGPNIDVPVSSVVGYLSLNGKLSGLIKYAASPPATEAGIAGAELVAVINCPNAPNFQTSQSGAYSAVSGLLTALAGDSNSNISSTDATALLALSATLIPWWQTAGLSSPISTADTTTAGLT
jgi:hypothetical protein